MGVWMWGEADAPSPPTPEAFEYFVPFRELWAGRDKLKTSAEHQWRSCEEMKVYEPKILGVLQSEVLDPAEKHVRIRKSIEVSVCSLFSTMVCCLFLSSWRHRLNFYTIFSSPGDYSLVIIKPLNSLTEFSCSSTCYHPRGYNRV